MTTLSNETATVPNPLIDSLKTWFSDDKKKNLVCDIVCQSYLELGTFHKYAEKRFCTEHPWANLILRTAARKLCGLSIKCSWRSSVL